LGRRLRHEAILRHRGGRSRSVTSFYFFSIRCPSFNRRLVCRRIARRPPSALSSSLAARSSAKLVAVWSSTCPAVGRCENQNPLKLGEECDNRVGEGRLPSWLSRLGIRGRVTLIRRARSDKQLWRPWHLWRCTPLKICKLQISRGGRRFESHPHRQIVFNNFRDEKTVHEHYSRWVPGRRS
jgi:hypothetical protein